MTVSTWNGLIVDFADRIGVHVIVRGVRALADFDYEFELSQMNRSLNPRIETIFLPDRPEVLGDPVIGNQGDRRFRRGHFREWSLPTWQKRCTRSCARASSARTRANRRPGRLDIPGSIV